MEEITKENYKLNMLKKDFNENTYLQQKEIYENKNLLKLSAINKYDFNNGLLKKSLLLVLVARSLLEHKKEFVVNYINLSKFLNYIETDNIILSSALVSLGYDKKILLWVEEFEKGRLCYHIKINFEIDFKNYE